MTKRFLIVGAPGATVAGKNRRGKVFIFDRETYEPAHTLKPPDPATDVGFGFSVYADRDGRLLIGAPRGGGAGRMMLYQLLGGE